VATWLLLLHPRDEEVVFVDGPDLESRFGQCLQEVLAGLGHLEQWVPKDKPGYLKDDIRGICGMNGLPADLGV